MGTIKNYMWIMIKSRVKEIYQKATELSLDILIPIYILSLGLELAHFFPTLNRINIWDEASYIHSGYRLLTAGEFPNLANSPLSSLFYGITILPVINSPDYFVLANAIGRIILFSLIFFSTCLIARALKPYANSWIMLAMIVIVPVAAVMFLFPSDVLFAGFSGLAFWQMISFYKSRLPRHLWWASAFMGIGMLARAEGLLLMGVMLVVTVLMILRDQKISWRILPGLLTPFIMLVVSFILFYGLSTGDFDTGLAGRTFYNFESGHEVIYSQTGIFIPTVSARLESQEAFGTPEENNHSVFRAILRNPPVYFERLRRSVPSFVKFTTRAYGHKFILIFGWLSLRGLIALIRDRHCPLAVMSILWFIPLGVGWLNTFFREGYFLMPYFVVFSLSSIGLTRIIQNFDDKKEQIGIVIASSLLVLVSLVAGNTTMLYRGVLFILGLGLIYLLRLRIRDFSRWRNHALWLLLAVVLVMRGGYPSPELPDYGNSGLEQSVYFLQDHFQAGSHILSGAPANIWAARMIYYGINAYDIPDFADENEFLIWIQAQDIHALYIDQHFPAAYKDMALSLVGEGLEEIYTTSNRGILIYQVDSRGDL